MGRIPLIRPFITDEVKQKVAEVLDSGYLTEGPVTREFEQCVKDYLGCTHVLAVCNCTVGLEMALRAWGIGPGDEVIVPDYTYPATAAVVNIVGAHVTLVDINPETMLIDYDVITEAITPRTRAVIPVSIFGNPLDYSRLNALRDRHKLFILEDSACSIGAEYNNMRVGNHADISVFSLHPRKFITTGEGGLITTNDGARAEWMNAYKHFGMDGGHSRAATHFATVGANYKLSNVQAAIGLVQMKHIDTLLAQRTRLAGRYRQFLAGHSGITLPAVTTGGVPNWQSCCVFVDNRDRVIEALRKRDIEVQIGTYALHQHRAFSENPACTVAGDMKGSRYAFEHCLTLPLYHDMTDQEQDFVIEQLLEVVAGCKVGQSS